MSNDFSQIPDIVIEYVRKVFRLANDDVSRTLSTHPSMHEEFLDFQLIQKLSSQAPAFFAAEKIGVVIESHWLGGRWMFGRWEVADIAFFMIIRKNGHLSSRKVALLQTKRLYSHEISVEDFEDEDYRIGIGRIADRDDPLISLSSQRAFTFDENSIYGAIRRGHQQIETIKKYNEKSGIPIYYALYNPLAIPFKALYPSLDGEEPVENNSVGCRVLPSDFVHSAVNSLSEGQAPKFSQFQTEDNSFQSSTMPIIGWRLENFIADEVLRCREGKLFEDKSDDNLSRLLYRRSAPISAAITITIDISDVRRD